MTAVAFPTLRAFLHPFRLLWLRPAALPQALLEERERWPLWLPVAFGGGIASYFALPAEPSPLAAAAACASLALATLLWRRTSFAPFLILLLLVAGGFLAAGLRTASVDSPRLPAELDPRRVEGRLLHLEQQSRGQRLLLDEVAIEGIALAETPARVRITLPRSAPDLRAGDRIGLIARLRPPPRPEVPDGYDFARAAYFERLGAVGFALGEIERLGAKPEPGLAGAWTLFWSDARQQITARVLAALPGERGALAAAITTGERGSLPESLIAAMRDCGLAHLLAISGLHVGLVAAMLFFTVRLLLAAVPFLALRWPIKKWAACCGACAAFLYLFLAGATVPTQRAFLTLLLVLLAVLLDRRALGLRLVASAAFAVLLLAPESLLTPSFQLSFAAVSALGAGYEVLRRRRLERPERRWPSVFAYVGGLAFSSLLATVATAPYGLYHFNRLALYGVLANLLAVPLFGLWIMPLAVLSLAAMPLGLEGYPLEALALGLDLLTRLARTIAALPGAVMLWPAMSGLSLGVATLAGLWLVIWRGRHRWLGLVLALLCCLAAFAERPPDLLVSADPELVGMIDEAGALRLSSRRRGTFTAEQWLRRLGLEEAEAWPRRGDPTAGSLTCGRAGCLLRGEGLVVALPRRAEALARACRLAQLVILLQPLGSCPERRPDLQVLDRERLVRDGTHAIWLGGAALRIRSVADSRGRRPWSRPWAEELSAGQ